MTSWDENANWAVINFTPVGWVILYRGWNTGQLYSSTGIMISHFKDPYWNNQDFMECHDGGFWSLLKLDGKTTYFFLLEI